MWCSASLHFSERVQEFEVLEQYAKAHCRKALSLLYGMQCSARTPLSGCNYSLKHVREPDISLSNHLKYSSITEITSVLWSAKHPKRPRPLGRPTDTRSDTQILRRGCRLKSRPSRIASLLFAAFSSSAKNLFRGRKVMFRVLRLPGPDVEKKSPISFTWLRRIWNTLDFHPSSFLAWSRDWYSSRMIRERHLINRKPGGKLEIDPNFLFAKKRSFSLSYTQ
jgi:hypothetical protein